MDEFVGAEGMTLEKIETAANATEKRLGFDNVLVEDQWKFTHIHVIKVRRQPQSETLVHF